MVKVYNTQLCQNNTGFPHPEPPHFQCENWTVNQVGEWLKGVDDGIMPYLGHFIALGIDGKRLVNVDSDTLKKIGINREATRIKITNAINLLLYYGYSIKYENLQKLALKTSLSSNELLNAVSQATPVINNSSNVSKHIEMLNCVLRALADTYEAATRLIFWLERNPFVGNKKFTKLRNNITALVDEMVDCVNNPNNPKFFSVPQVLVERAHSIRKICTEIIQMDDPSVLYTAFLERITIRRPPASDWGFEFGRTCLGVNLITRVDYNSPAAFSDKFDVGDEILEIDGTPVIGWKYSNLLRKMNAKLLPKPGQQFSTFSGDVDLHLLLCKRPRERGSPQRAQKMQVENRNEQERKHLNKLTWDFKNKIGTDYSKKWHRQKQPQSKDDNDHLALRRARSSSFTVSSNSNSRRCSECSLPQTSSRCISLLMPTGKQPLFRRASVWNESPPATLRSPFEGFQSESNSWLLLLASWGNGNESRPRIAEKPERIHQKPPPLKNLFHGSGISVLIEERMSDEELSENGTGIIFSSIEIVPESELAKLGKGELLQQFGMIEATEWAAPVKEDITGLQIQRNTFLDSGNNPTTIIIDSPLSNIHAKIARFFYGDVPSPNPATFPSSIPFATEQTQAKQTPNWQRQLANSECRTPITPNSKFSLELPISAGESTKHGGDESSSICSVDSPSSYSTIVKTIASRCRLAPLAEPDEIGDLSLAFGGTDKNEENTRQNKEEADRQQKLAQMFKIPVQGHQSIVPIQGLLRRELFPMEQKRQPFRASFRRKRWTKCWALISDRILYIYSDQMAKEADIIVQLQFCTLSKTPEFRTSKKHTFVLKSNNDAARLHFATYSANELNNWVGNIVANSMMPKEANLPMMPPTGGEYDCHQTPTSTSVMLIRHGSRNRQSPNVLINIADSPKSVHP